MLVFGVILLVMFDLTIIITYMIVEGVKNNLGPRRVPFRENEKNIDGVSKSNFPLLSRHHTALKCKHKQYMHAK